MNIKTWREREFDAIGFVAVSPASNVIHMRAEIDDLRAALAERDAEIERLKYTVKKRDVGIEICGTLSVKMEAKLAAQRKVLEQALEAIEDFVGYRPDIDAAITAIQEVLK